MCYGKMLRIAGQWPSDGKQISERLKENMVQNRFKVVSNAVPYFWVSGTFLPSSEQLLCNQQYCNRISVSCALNSHNNAYARGLQQCRASTLPPELPEGHALR